MNLNLLTTANYSTISEWLTIPTQTKTAFLVVLAIIGITALIGIYGLLRAEDQKDSAELNKMKDFISVELGEGRTVTANAIAKLLGVSERTARGKLASLKETHPEIFNSIDQEQA